jgi:DNA-binding GntR family transcriptional regulator
VPSSGLHKNLIRWPAERVLDEIRAGRSSMGDRVLAHLLGVSRITSKKALQTLSRDGVVEGSSFGKGSFFAHAAL